MPPTLAKLLKSQALVDLLTPLYDTTTGALKLSSAQVDALAALSAAEGGVLDGVTPGTVLASKAAVVDANKDIADFRNLSGTNLKAGKDAVAGTVTIFPTTTAKGSAKFDVTDQTGNTQVTHRTGAMGQATVITTPDPGAAAANVVLSEGTATINGAKTFSSQILTSSNVGAAATGTTAVEYGDGRNHVTVLTVSTTLPAIAGGANLAVGKLLYTMPAGACVIRSAKMSLAITQSQGNITADTPDGGLGSVIGSGVVATLDGTGTFEDILTGQTFNDCNGTAEVKTVANQPMVMETGAAHTVHFNVADGWAASGDAAAGLAGTVILDWVFLG